MADIFWVEDQLHWIEKFKSILQSADFGDGKAKNNLQIHRFAESASQSINHTKLPPDIVILDANMNGNDQAGLSLSKLIAQKWPHVSIIYLSEHSGTDIEQQVFEQATAKDFIAKHQQNIEQVLCWRIKALLRQQSVQKSADNTDPKDILQSGELIIDLATWNVYWHGEKLMNPSNKQRPLAPTPRKMLRELVNVSPRPVTTTQMAERLNMEKLTYANYRQHIKVLRHSFEQAAKTKAQTSFLELCKQGRGVVTFGDDEAYCWIK